MEYIRASKTLEHTPNFYLNFSLKQNWGYNMDYAPYYLLSFKRKMSPVFVPCRLCSMSHQPSIGAVSGGWPRNLRYPPGSSPRDLGAGPSWKLHGHLMFPLSTHLFSGSILPWFLPTLPRMSLRQSLMETAQMRFKSRSFTVLVVLFDFIRSPSFIFKHR